MSLTLRRTKGSQLTWDEVDANWTAGRTFDGQLQFADDALFWDDLLGAAINLRVQGTGATANLTENTVDFSTLADLNDYLLDVQQLSHAWNGEAVSPHLHAWQTTAAAPNWLVRYRWQAMNALKVDAWTDLPLTLMAFDYPGSGTFHQLYYSTTGIVPPVGAGISDCIQFRILRDNANASSKFTGADPVNATASVISFDTHIAKNTLGSRLITQKF